MSRRSMLAGLASSAAGLATAGHAGATSIVPRARPAGLKTATAPAAHNLISNSRLSGKIGYVLADANTGEVLESHNPMLALPPASTSKALTALYALDHLGPEFRFETQVIATGPVIGGQLEGDLILLGGGDPMLDTDDLAGLVEKLVAAGITRIGGRFLYDPGALPHVRAIDHDQPDHVGYNPAIAGLNLNFNRVYFEWKKQSSGWDVVLDARARKYRPKVHSARMRIVDRAAPIYTYARADGVDDWTVASRALGKGGGRWLPVRDPGAYTAEVFQTIARSQGIVLPGPQIARTGPGGGQVMAAHYSPPLQDILRGMLKYSTNLTAEAVGMTASLKQGAEVSSLSGSAAQMKTWLAGDVVSSRARFQDHSGLSDRSHLPAADMVRALIGAGQGRGISRLMKEVPMRDPQGRHIKAHPAKISAKTGTLNFVSSLAGYIERPGKRDLAFAIFTADESRRAKLSREERERPPGGRSWSNRSRILQGNLLNRWSTIYQA